jgi:hypothetical protein
MALIRSLAKLSTTALVADVFILAGLVYIRFFVVMGCTALSLAGAKDLDKFVAFVGSFAWKV